MAMLAAHPTFNANPPPKQYDAGWWRQTLNKIAGAFFPATARTITVSGTMTVQDDLVLADATHAAVVYTLLPASECQFWKGTIKKVDGVANDVTITATGTDTIDGASTYALTAQWQAATIQSDGSAFYLLATV